MRSVERGLFMELLSVILVMCRMCTSRYISEEWNTGIDKMDAGLVDSAV